MKLVYLLGPFRAATAWEIEQNVRRAEEVALALWKLGAAVICPHTNTRFFQGQVEDGRFLFGGLEMLERCDGVVSIAGSAMSFGSIRELAFVHGLRMGGSRMRHFRWPEDMDQLKGWIEGRQDVADVGPAAPGGVV